MVQLLRYLLFPISLLYAAGVHVRNFLFDMDVFKGEKFSTPTIVIGNLSVGGTGKTPMVAYLIELLSPHYKIAVLSRGYKRKTKGIVIADGSSSVFDIGDEPFQIAKKYPFITMAVDADRRNGIRELERLISPELIILDDAYQHRWVRPSMTFLLTSYGELYPNDWYLPTGNLRDAKNQAKRADSIVVTKCPRLPAENEKKKLVAILRPKTSQSVVFGELKYDNRLIGLERTTTFEAVKGKQVALVTGIANPTPLLIFLKSKGLVFEHLKFPDHHNFTDKEIQSFKTYDVVVTTEKDFVRLDGRLSNAYYIKIQHRFSENDNEIILRGITKILKSDPQHLS
jgi:tetraacyldisaccharide 4'-kinase